MTHHYFNVAPLCECGCEQFTKFNERKLEYNRVILGHISKEHLEKRCESIKKAQRAISKEKRQEILSRTHETLLQRYGKKNALQVEQFKEKARKTCQEKYGTDSYWSSEKSVQEKIKNNTLDWQTILAYCSAKNCEPLFAKEIYHSNRQILQFKCKVHDTIFEAKMVNIQRNYSEQCPKCKGMGVSKKEKELVNFVKTICQEELRENVRDIIYPYELDIYFPKLNKAIEFDGGFWHSSDKAAQRDQLKNHICQEKKIDLLRIKEKDWDENREMAEQAVRSFLSNTSQIPLLSISTTV